MKLETYRSGYKVITSRPVIPEKKSVVNGNNSLPGCMKYHEIPKIAFGSQLVQIKQPEPRINPLDAAKIFPVEGVEHAKEWPISVNSLKTLKERFMAAQIYNNIDTNQTPGLAVYNIDSSGRRYIGFYDALTNKLTITEGVVLFDIDKKGNLVDEALAHESYHCKQAQHFSALPDEAVTGAIDNRLTEALTTGQLPVYEMIVGEKFSPVSKETAHLLVKLSKDSDNDPTEADLQKLTDFMEGYADSSKKFVINILKKLRWTYEKNLVIGFEPALKANLFTMEDLEQRIPEKVLKKIMLSSGLSKQEALEKIVNEKPGKLIMMGYISQIDADNARKVRQKILSNPEKPDEATLLRDLQNVFDMIEVAFILGLANNDKVKDINLHKVMEDYMYCSEEINARQTGLSHKIKILQDLVEHGPENKNYQHKEDLKTAQADFKLNEIMTELVQLRKQHPEDRKRIDELTKQATEVAKKAEYTVPKMLNKKNENYIPFSYGDNYRLTLENSN